MTESGGSLQVRQRSPGASPSSSSSSSNSGSTSNSDSGSSSGQTSATIWPPLRFTFNCEVQQSACQNVDISYTGGCKPYSLSAFWFEDGEDHADTTWIKLREQTWDESFQWSILAPVSSRLLFTLTDARGITITSEDAIFVKSNGLGMAQDRWCQYTYNSQAVPTAATNSSHKYAWNGTDDDDDDSSTGILSHTVTSSGDASEITSSGVDTNATDLNDQAHTTSKAIHDANQAKTIEGILSALLGISLIAVGVLAYLFMRTRRRLRHARAELSARQLGSMYNGGHPHTGLQGIMTEKPGHNGYAVAQYSSHTGEGMVTPRPHGGAGAAVRNPFDDAAAAAAFGNARSPFLSTPVADRGRLSTTSLVSAVPSHGARSTAADSSLSTEYYHTYKASTIPPRDPNSSTGNGGPLGMMRSLFGAPMSFFSSASSIASASGSAARVTSSPAPSSTTHYKSRRSTGEDSSTDYYGDRNSLSGPGTSISSNPSVQTVQIPITRVWTGSEASTHLGSDISDNSNSSNVSSSRSHLAPPSSSQSTTSRRSSSSNGRSTAVDESSTQAGDDEREDGDHQEDVYDDESDRASFSNFSFVETGSSIFSDAHAVPSQSHYR